MLSIAHSISPLRLVSLADPLKSIVKLDGLGGTAESSAVSVYAYAVGGVYDSVAISTVSEVNVDWKLSIDGTTWVDEITLRPFQSLLTADSELFYVKAVVANDNTIPEGVDVTAIFRIIAREGA